MSGLKRCPSYRESNVRELRNPRNNSWCPFNRGVRLIEVSVEEETTVYNLVCFFSITSFFKLDFVCHRTLPTAGQTQRSRILSTASRRHQFGYSSSKCCVTGLGWSNFSWQLICHNAYQLISEKTIDDIGATKSRVLDKSQFKIELTELFLKSQTASYKWAGRRQHKSLIAVSLSGYPVFCCKTFPLGCLDCNSTIFKVVINYQRQLCACHLRETINQTEL